MGYAGNYIFACRFASISMGNDVRTQTPIKRDRTRYTDANVITHAQDTHTCNGLCMHTADHANGLNTITVPQVHGYWILESGKRFIFRCRHCLQVRIFDFLNTAPFDVYLMHFPPFAVRMTMVLFDARFWPPRALKSASSVASAVVSLVSYTATNLRE